MNLAGLALELQAVVRSDPGLGLVEALKRSADRSGTTPGQMKYALSFANVRGMVEIDYDNATLTAPQPQDDPSSVSERGEKS